MSNPFLTGAERRRFAEQLRAIKSDLESAAAVIAGSSEHEVELINGAIGDAHNASRLLARLMAQVPDPNAEELLPLDVKPKRKLKVFGGAYRLNGIYRQVRAIVAATSWTAAANAIMKAQGIAAAPTSYINRYWAVTGNADEIALATAQPGKIFFQYLSGPDQRTYFEYIKGEPDRYPRDLPAGSWL